MTIDQIINKVKENDPQADTDLLALAYEYAEKAHGSQKRKSGEPYIQHCLHTAFVLAQIKADLNTVIAGILHDVPEDTDRTLEDIQKNFGEEVAFLVEGITKLSKIKYRGVERYRESLRKMFLAMAKDVRVILIKFSDRLHNLRTLDALPKEKRLRIAQETMEIYAPIAGILGVWRLKWQLEDICFKYLYPEEYKKLEYKYEVEKKVERNKYTQKVKNILGQKLQENNITFTIESRFKHLYSIYKKIQQKDRQFDEIYDVFALRVIVPTIQDCYKTLGIIHGLWKPKANRIKDYIAVPKPNGYSSLHTTVFGPENKATEFQIRTPEMHEKSLYGIAAHWHYKQMTGGDAKPGKQPRWIQDLLNIQRDAKDTDDFIQKIKVDVFKNRIFVFSPKGDVFDLPENSTPIDFAYAVHTEIGNKAMAALVNTDIAPLDRALKNGDLVEIVIDKKRKGPNRDWLKFVKSHRAKEKIMQAAKVSRFEQLRRIIPGI
ncbi:MAG: RelA/SpoT family protein [Candidatus Falkowbacteria bacterium GW2011_GWC2_38_22]|uniref:RelA/SpoT family protein n=1 Tax=Candidatus Falkowbacteria bacterium GW2011_GWE1_38_31 TaxID=1618638 RepID=A0A0G0JQR5_9BACT|nr:MAG: RelA/SpoT family protein [Candidatus Falkowbacteria bacterium GW2011_GWF2_38_1205]KKQ61273.1 MAG: RelA/SpoT family protein [Candidatus Falkowbacteria bacterium GW2011_GWC2_38_22]KKQ63155.1 MAG: RelA/SpoT family protein [Candidatus Falkowbacteria bacterium GW2011_GWF1_38_22]KKQ65352.1 MAG: RelA/SpoT family protein [Candidatus Falkowbacteria bacterium GW2011_GWE2_38_254]KKQ69928.1 MAG: RelA/SpoT family protein [Candidatus Falkowbacteria bacterium GW2011_GWE1_38_31]KKQ72492.1 MAG: RelA/Sp